MGISCEEGNIFAKVYFNCVMRIMTEELHFGKARKMWQVYNSCTCFFSMDIFCVSNVWTALMLSFISFTFVISCQVVKHWLQSQKKQNTQLTCYTVENYFMSQNTLNPEKIGSHSMKVWIITMRYHAESLLLASHSSSLYCFNIYTVHFTFTFGWLKQSEKKKLLFERE